MASEEVVLPPMQPRGDTTSLTSANSFAKPNSSFRQMSSRASITARGLVKSNKRRVSVIGGPNPDAPDDDAEILAPTCTCRVRIPGLYGEWGPFFNTDLTRGEWHALGWLCVGTIVIFAISGLAAYFYRISRLDFECEELPFLTTVSYFLNLDHGALQFCLGMVQGIIFGAIDNGGLWAGMDAMDPLFNPDKVPWVYGRGGRRFFSGLNHRGACVYSHLEFIDGKLTPDERSQVDAMCRDLQKDYDRRLEEDDLQCNRYNEACFADPKSPMFLGAKIPKRLFIYMLQNSQMNAQTYKRLLEIYSFVSKTQEESEDNASLAGGEANGQDADSASDTGSQAPPVRDELDAYFRASGQCPGKSRHLANSMVQGWEPGRLTQAGIGNTFSDFVGGVVSVFIATMIITATGQCTNSIIAEVLGLVVGCLLGMAVCRMLSSKT